MKQPETAALKAAMIIRKCDPMGGFTPHYCIYVYIVNL